MTDASKPSLDQAIQTGTAAPPSVAVRPADVVPSDQRGQQSVDRPFKVVTAVTRLPRAVLAAPWRLSGALIFFIIAVIVPTIAAAVYLFAFASNQYVAESRFGVRFADLQKNDASAIFEGMPSASQIGLASTAITQYLQSREIVDALQSRINLRSMYANPRIDYLSRLAPNATSEQLVDYWKGKVDPFFDLTTGAISVRVKAFTPEDAKRISETIITLSEALINDMTLRSREQTIKLNKDEVAAAERRLQKSRDEMQVYRNGRSVIDTSKEADARLSIVTKLRGDLFDAQTALTRQRSYMNADAPSVKDTEQQIIAIRGQLAAAEGQLTAKDGGSALSTSMGGYEALEAETLFAQKYYDGMLEALFKAQQDVARQMSYLAVFVHPSLPQSSLYPRRFEDVGIVFLAGAGMWMVLLLAFRAMREHVI